MDNNIQRRSDTADNTLSFLLVIIFVMWADSSAHAQGTGHPSRDHYDRALTKCVNFDRDADGYFFESHCPVPVKIGYYCKDAGTGRYEALGEVEMNSGERRHAPCFLARANTDYAVCPQGDYFEGADGGPWRPEKVFACRNPLGGRSDASGTMSHADSGEKPEKNRASRSTSLAGSRWTCSSDAFAAVDWAWQFIDLYDYKLTFLSDSSAIHAIYNFVQGQVVLFHSTWNIAGNGATETLDGEFLYTGPNPEGQTAQAAQDAFKGMQFGPELASSPPEQFETPSTRKTVFTTIRAASMSGYIVIPADQTGGSSSTDRRFMIGCTRM